MLTIGKKKTFQKFLKSIERICSGVSAVPTWMLLNIEAANKLIKLKEVPTGLNKMSNLGRIILSQQSAGFKSSNNLAELKPKRFP